MSLCMTLSALCFAFDPGTGRRPQAGDARALWEQLATMHIMFQAMTGPPERASPMVADEKRIQTGGTKAGAAASPAQEQLETFAPNTGLLCLGVTAR